MVEEMGYYTQAYDGSIWEMARNRLWGDYEERWGHGAFHVELWPLVTARAAWYQSGLRDEVQQWITARDGKWDIDSARHVAPTRGRSTVQYI